MVTKIKAKIMLTEESSDILFKLRTKRYLKSHKEKNLEAPV